MKHLFIVNPTAGGKDKTELVRRRVEEARPPKCFEGLPITLVSAAIVALSFTGFGGLVENIFGG